MTTIYLIRAGDTDLYKIGYTTRDVESRRSALQTGNPYPLSVVATWEGTPSDERRIHALLEGCRREGEWFELTVPALITLLAQSDGYVQNLEGLSSGKEGITPLTDKEAETRLIADIRSGYLEWGPTQEEDGGVISISEWYQKLVTMGLVTTATWRWYSYEQICEHCVQVGIDLEDRYDGQETVIEHCLGQGHIERGDYGYRINPCLERSGYEVFMDVAGLL